MKNTKQYELKGGRGEKEKEKEQAQVNPAKAHRLLDKGQLSAEYLQ